MAQVMPSTQGDEWNHLAKIYKSLTTGVATKPIGRILHHANRIRPFARATAILDNGCGPGPILTQIIQDFGAQIPAETTFLAADFSQGMIDAVRETQENHKGQAHWDKVTTQVLDATNMQGLEDDSFSHITAGWVYFMTPDPFACLTESHRLLHEDGVLSLSSWQGNAWMSVMQAGLKVKPDTPVGMPDIPDIWKTIEGVTGELRKAGFRDVGAEEVEVSMRVESREQMVDFFMNAMPHVKKAMQHFSEQEKAKARELMLEEMIHVCPQEPGDITGVTVVGWGKK